MCGPKSLILGRRGDRDVVANAVKRRVKVRVI